MKSVCDLLLSLNQAHPWWFFFSSRSHWLSDERVALQKNWRTGSEDLNSISYSPLTSQVTLGKTAHAELGLGQIMFSSNLIYWFPHWFPCSMQRGERKHGVSKAHFVILQWSVEISDVSSFTFSPMGWCTLWVNNTSFLLLDVICSIFVKP